MSTDDLVKKLGAVFSHFGKGKDQKIKPADVQKIIAKLRMRRDELQKEANAATGTQKAARLNQKLASAEQLLARAEWLLAEIQPDATNPPAVD
ncbi:hypothetical protein [Roseinatronobacter sp. S2]|uniref:hypothetical protein n=1 Tax=Roseinatronobacter sp. S2 TaxID=3035471 RepID=UPI00240EAD19|nr:hypothetical protein [Roseinatronobacter sp. S2]WFE75649.1 hypothetical protein P8S53_04345 [Roseinatronobacter sp. S2]